MGRVDPQQIRECALFVPLISANTNARSDRSHLFADDHPFLLPVLIDDTPETAARVPDRVRERHWSRLRDGERHARALSAAGALAMTLFDLAWSCFFVAGLPSGRRCMEESLASTS